MASPEELFAEFMPSISEIYSEYIEGVANRSLQKYKLVIHERGSKEGEPLFTHVMSGIGVLTRLAAPEIMDLSDTELRILLSAFTVHDINKIKLFDDDKLPFNKLASLENVAAALEDIEIGAFFPEWKDYLGDITMLVRAHSSQNNTVGEILIRTHDRTRLDREAVNRLVPLIRAADIADLSQSLEERIHKAKVLKRLHEVSTHQYAFATHRIAEQRGLLTNILHRAVQDHLSERGAIPLLFYPDGVAYLVLRSGVSIDFESIAEGFANSVAQKLSSGFRQFIHAEPSGILIEPQCLEQDMVEVWRAVFEMIVARPYAKKVDDLSAKIRGR
ncbi:MAG: hypothetical protein JWN14_1472, partial [Chthonomonadales bacterium]|nr:hypothetical protein [Chthonomonadales bacterium]